MHGGTEGEMGAVEQWEILAHGVDDPSSLLVRLTSRSFARNVGVNGKK